MESKAKLHPLLYLSLIFFISACIAAEFDYVFKNLGKPAFLFWFTLGFPRGCSDFFLM